MKSKTADSWAELDREIDEVIAKLNAEQPELDLDKLLAVSEEEGKALLASLEAERDLAVQTQAGLWIFADQLSS